MVFGHVTRAERLRNQSKADVLVVAGFLQGRRHLPHSFVAALIRLIPGLKEALHGEFDPDVAQASPDIE